MSGVEPTDAQLARLCLTIHAHDLQRLVGRGHELARLAAGA